MKEPSDQHLCGVTDQNAAVSGKGFCYEELFVPYGACHWCLLSSSMAPLTLLEAMLGPRVLQEQPVCCGPTEHLLNN